MGNQVGSSAGIDGHSPSSDGADGPCTWLRAAPSIWCLLLEALSLEVGDAHTLLEPRGQGRGIKGTKP